MTTTLYQCVECGQCVQTINEYGNSYCERHDKQ